VNNNCNIPVLTSVMLLLGINDPASENTHFTKKDLNFKALMESMCMVFEWRTKHNGILEWDGGVYRVSNMLLISQAKTNQIYRMPKYA
jgi:hypothetical protein